MFGRKKTYNSIVVEYYKMGADSSVQTASHFHTARHHIAELPDTFEIRTTLNIEGDEWLIWAAVPPTKEEFRLTGQLKVYAYQPVVKAVNPDTVILYGLPTLSEDFPTLVDRASMENVFVVHEDDWRQREFISDRYSENIEDDRVVHTIELQARPACIRQGIPRWGFHNSYICGTLVPSFGSWAGHSDRAAAGPIRACCADWHAICTYHRGCGLGEAGLTSS